MFWALALFFLFVIGLAIGSFLNVVVFRLHAERSLWRERSGCMACSSELLSRDLIPVVSFLLLRGRCRNCDVALSWQYPVVELFTGLIWLGAGLFWLGEGGVWDVAGGNLLLLAQFGLVLFLVSSLLVVLVYDAKYFLIPNVVTYPLFVVGVLGGLLVFGADWRDVVVGVLVGGGFFLIPVVLSRGRSMGLGDVKLGFVMGAWVWWPHILIVLMMSLILGSVVAIGLLIGRKRGLSDRLPLGVFLATGTILFVIFERFIVDWEIYQMAGFHLLSFTVAAW